MDVATHRDWSWNVSYVWLFYKQVNYKITEFLQIEQEVNGNFE